MDNEAFLFEVWDYIGGLGESSLTDNQRVFATIWLLEADVNNGGFSQFFFNSGDAYALEAPSALTTIGAVSCAALTEIAIAVVQAGNLNWKNDKARREFFCSLPQDVEERLSTLDEEFYKYPDNLSDLLAAFARSHITEFQPANS